MPRNNIATLPSKTDGSLQKMENPWPNCCLWNFMFNGKVGTPATTQKIISENSHPDGPTSPPSFGSSWAREHNGTGSDSDVKSQRKEKEKTLSSHRLNKELLDLRQLFQDWTLQVCIMLPLHRPTNTQTKFKDKEVPLPLFGTSHFRIDSPAAETPRTASINHAATLCRTMSLIPSAHIHKSQHTCRTLGLNENPSIA